MRYFRTIHPSFQKLLFAAAASVLVLFAAPSDAAQVQANSKSATDVRVPAQPLGGANEAPRRVLTNGAGHVTAQTFRRPSYFERNDGQVDPAILYFSRGPGYSLFLTRTGATIVLSTSANEESRKGEEHSNSLQLSFAGANPDTTVTGVEQLPGKSNYFEGSDPKLWHTNIPQYAKVRYANLYPGIDLVFYSRDGHLEYDVNAASGADISRVQIRADRAEMRLTKDGDVVFQPGRFQPVRLVKPRAFQPDEHGNAVGVKYRLHEGRLSFVVDRFDGKAPLTIDPALIFSASLNSGTVAQMAVDSSGVYLTGQAEDPTTMEPQTFILKLDPTGSQVIYETFLSSSTSSSIAVDGQGSVYVVGSATVPPTATGTAPFPLTKGVFSGTVPATPHQFSVPFAAKLSADGSTLLYSTLLQQPTPNATLVPSQQQQGLVPSSVAVDSSGALYVVGIIAAVTPPSIWMQLPVTTGAFETSPNPAGNGFVMKVNSDATGLDYSTYLDATSVDGLGLELALDSSGDAYITGGATSAFQPTAGAYQSTLSDSFVMELNPAGTAPVYATFFGPYDVASASFTVTTSIAVDSSGEAVISGTSSGTLPVTATAFCGNPSVPSGSDFFSGFVAKLTAGGSGLAYLSTLCGNDANGGSVAVDSAGNIYLLDTTADPTSFEPVLLNPVEGYIVSPPSGNSTTMVALKMDNAGSLQWSTFLGTDVESTNLQCGCEIAVDSTGAAYIFGADFLFPTTANAVGAPNGRLNRLLKIAPALGAPVPIVTPNVVSFGNQNVSSASASMDVHVGNFGDTPMSPLIAVSGDFSENNTCANTVAGGQKCDVNVIFTPTATGTRNGTLTVSFGGSIPSQTVSLGGTGTAPVVTLAPASLSFGDQTTGTTSGAEQVTITNDGTGPLSISSFQTTSEFAATNTCGGPVAAGNSCSVQVTFTPTASGSQTGTLTITDNAPNSPQTVALAGNQPANFAISSGSSSTSATVTAGQPATYGLTVTGMNGFSGAVNFTCTGAPANASCSVSPNPANITGNTAASVSVTIATQAASAVPPVWPQWPNHRHRTYQPLIGLLGLALLIWLATPNRRVQFLTSYVSAGALLILLAVCVACGSGSGSSPSPSQPSQPGTPSGQYTITVTGSSSSISQSMKLTLTVN